MTRLVNLTTHEVVVMSVDGHVLTRCPISGRFARLRERRRPLPSLGTDGGAVPMIQVGYDEIVDDLPEPQPDTTFIVSRVLAAAVQRDDLVFPADEVRDAEGRIIGCRALARFAGGASDRA